MKQLKTLFNLDRNRITDGEWGVEIEVEGDRLPTNLDRNIWRVEIDGSLKAAEAYEYVMPIPTSIEGVKASLDYLESKYEENKTLVHDSIRAGVHVHMNVQTWNIKQLMTFATCYYILEDLLVRWCGENREGNLFCLRTRDAEGVLFALHEAMERKDVKYLMTEEIRYSSLNYCALGKYGSVEFRAMRGTGDLNLIYTWVEILKELRDNSLSFNDPAEVIISMSGEGEEMFLRRMLPTKYHLFYRYENIPTIIRKACRRIQMIAFTIDWNNICRPSNNPFNLETF